MDKKYQVFISSTFTDLIEERRAIIESILDLNHIPSGMEAFPAADVEQFNYIKKVIDACDYYVLIIGARYGSTTPTGLSYTEREYDYALESGKTVLAFICDHPENLTGHGSESAELSARLQAFRDRVAETRLVRYWPNREALRASVIISLTHAINETPATGWVRGDTAASTDILARINELRDENERLHAELRQYHEQEAIAASDLAGLEDSLHLRYSVWIPRSGRANRSLTLTWSQIFAAIGPHLISPSTSAAIDLALRRYIHENHGSSVTSIFNTDIDTIKLHLEAIGLLKIYSAGSVKGSVQEFVELTEVGRRALSNLSAVRRPSPA